MNNQWFSKVAVWLVIALVLFTVFKQFDRGAMQGNQIGYSDFLEEVRAKRIKSVTLQEGNGGTEILAVTSDDKRLRTTATYLDRGLVGDLITSGVKFDVKPREEPSLLMSILVSWGPMLLLIGVWVYFMRQMQGGGKGGHRHPADAGGVRLLFHTRQTRGGAPPFLHYLVSGDPSNFLSRLSQQST